VYLAEEANRRNVSSASIRGGVSGHGCINAGFLNLCVPIGKKVMQGQAFDSERSTALGSSDVWLHIGPC
jgi:hypothetical protein